MREANGYLMVPAIGDKRHLVIGQNKSGNDIIQYRGWTIYKRSASGRFSICKEGHQSRHNHKDIESAKAGIDAIVG